jgi:hypothetical protein
MEEKMTAESQYYLPLSGLDAVNYIMLGSVTKVAAHEDVPSQHFHFLDEFRDIIAEYKHTFRTVVTDDGSVRKSTNREVIKCMDNLLQRLDDAGLRLCFRMWSLPFDEIYQEVEITDNVGYKIDHDDSDNYDCQIDNSECDQINTRLDYKRRRQFGCGAVVAFLIVANILPLLIPDSGNGHPEICVNKVTYWDALPDLLAGA